MLKQFQLNTKNLFPFLSFTFLCFFFSFYSNYESPYRSTYSIPTSLGINPYHTTSQQSTTMPHSQSNYNNGSGNNHIQTPDSPRSTRSAPWPRSQQRSLFGNKPSSPRSVRSASTTGGNTDGRGGNSSNNHHHHHHSQHTHSRSSQRDHVTTSSTGTTTTQTNSHQQRYRSSSVESHSSNDSRSTRR